MKTRNLCGPVFIRVIVLLVDMFCAGTGALANENESDFEETKWKTKISVDFPGGSVADYVGVIKESAPGANVVLGPNVRGMKLPNLTGTKISVGSAISLIGELLLVNIQGVGDDEAFVITAVNAASRQRLETHIVSIRELFDSPGYQPGHVLSAIEAAIDLSSDHAEGAERVQIKLHKETGLLLIAGTEEDIETVARVVAELKDSIAPATEDGRVSKARSTFEFSIFSIQHADSEEVSHMLTELFSNEELSVVSDARTNSVVLRASKSTLQVVEAILLKLDGSTQSASGQTGRGSFRPQKKP